jgi:Cu/Ag efflux protein CusF
MKRFASALVALVVSGIVSIPAAQQIAFAQPAKGAAPSFDRVREVTGNRFKDMKLTGDPDQDFAAMLLVHYENVVYLAKVQLEFGGDRQLRQAAQNILDEQQKQIDDIKQWQVRMRRPSYEAQPSQSPPGSGPSGQMAQPATPVAPAPAQPAQAQPAQVSPAPLVSGTVEKVDAAAGRITIDHGPIPNLNMDGMTMVFRAQDPTMLKQVKRGDKIRFTAERVNGQITVTKIEKGR